MARARNIKPAFFQNDGLSELDPLTRLAFIGMWTIADFKGCIEYRPKMLKVQVLPYDECDMDAIAINLDKARFIRFYSVQGKRYIKIVNFEKHQNPHKNEKEAGSSIPDITDQDVINNKNSNLTQDGTKPDLIGTDRADSLLLIPSTLIPDSLIPETGSPSKDLSPPTASTKQKNGTRLPEDWVLPKVWGDWALTDKVGRTADEVRLLAEGFRDHWIANANQAKAKKSDWLAAWRIWTRSPYNVIKKSNGAIARQSENDQIREAARKRIFGEQTIESI